MQSINFGDASYREVRRSSRGQHTPGQLGTRWVIEQEKKVALPVLQGQGGKTPAAIKQRQIELAIGAKALIERTKDGLYVVITTPTDSPPDSSRDSFLDEEMPDWGDFMSLEPHLEFNWLTSESDSMELDPPDTKVDFTPLILELNEGLPEDPMEF
jgi:hypothetical protein